MHFIGWIIAGLIAGFVASKIVNKTGDGLVVDLLIGLAGGVIGGWVFSFFGMRVDSGFNILSIIVAIIGGVVLLTVYHLIRRNM